MSHTGGSLSDMAVDGTSMPNDAGIQNTIPSVPAPHQMHDSTLLDSRRPDQHQQQQPPHSLGGAVDVARSTRDTGMTGDVATGTGNSLPATVESKRLDADLARHTPGGHGRSRDTKAAQHKQHFERLAGPGEGANDAPGDTK